jgi:phage terminase small subunit
MPRGGYRPGAGRPKRDQPKPETVEERVSALPVTEDPVKFLEGLMNDPAQDIRIRSDAAKALLPYKHKKLGEGGKKEQQADDAKKVAGRFSTGAPPRLVSSGGKPVK